MAIGTPLSGIDPGQSNIYNPASLYSTQYTNAINAHNQAYNSARAGIQSIIAQVNSAQSLSRRGYPQLSRQAQARSDAALAAQEKGIQQLLAGYGGVRNQVNQDLTGPLQGWGAYGPTAQMIGKQYTNTAGTLDSRLTSRGIGSDSTVATELQRGPAMDRDLALSSLEGQMRQAMAQNDYNVGMGRLNAGFQGLGMNSNQRNLATQYLSQIGLAGLGAGQQYAGQIAGLGMQGIGVLSNLSQLPFPSQGLLGMGGSGPSTPGQGATTGLGGVTGGGMNFIKFPQQGADMYGGAGTPRYAPNPLGTGTVSPAYTYPQADAENSRQNWLAGQAAFESGGYGEG